MELALIRHFQTPGNGKGQYIGSTDEELDETKIPYPIPVYPKTDRLAVSPMKRCVQTAELIYPGMTREICPLLKELDFGEYERKTYEELKEEPAYRRWMDSGGLEAFPGGEDRRAFQERCKKGMEGLIESWTEQGCERGALVVHGGTIMAVMSAYGPGKDSFYHWQVKNGGGYLVKIDDREWAKGRRVFQRIRSLEEEVREVRIERT